MPRALICVERTIIVALTWSGATSLEVYNLNVDMPGWTNTMNS